jgi:pimeloyl-ACP methyl ester carboxylesterase
MQNNPPSGNIPEGTDHTPPLVEGGQSIPQTLSPTSGSVEGYLEPTYTEYAQPGVPGSYPPAAGSPAPPTGPPLYGAQVFGAPLLPSTQPFYGTPMPGVPMYPAYTPPTPQPGYIPPVSQPGYVAPTPQPGYMPSTLPPGYIPPAAQSGYLPSTLPPGYIPPAPQPGYVPPTLPPGQPPKRLDTWAIASLALVVLVLLAGVITGIAVLSHHNTVIVHPTPTTVVCSGNLTSCSTPGTQVATQTVHPTSAFQSALCPFPVGAGLTEGQQISCGYVTVPGNHSASDGQTVKLAVAIFKGQQYMNSTDPDPVLRLDGGPGGPSLDDWAKYIAADDYNTFIFNHDVIMFDQRGTGYSTPSLKCPELINLQYSTTDVSAQVYEQTARQCHDRLVSQGINLNDFNSIQNAGDVNDLIHALGYQQMTIYGVSYGTRLALTVMRLYPSVVHSAILDSTYPTNHNRSDLPSDAQRVFNVLFQGCAKDPNCNQQYPNLKNVFYNLVDTLNTHPITFPTVDPENNNQYTEPLSGDDMISWLFSALYATPFIPKLPQTIYQIKNHQYGQLSELYSELEFDSTFSDGMFYSTTCSEDWAFLTKQDITKSEQGIEPHLAKVFGGDDEQQEYAVCQFWNVQPVPAEQKQPVMSDLPTLILSGEYDPITPPSNGQEVAKDLSHSYFFLFPGQGHGEEYSSACSDQIVSAFENDSSQQPDGSCISQMTEPAFT